MPNADDAIVTREKLCDYLLSPTHPVGCAKAAWLARLGYTRAGWRTLQRDLRRRAKRSVTLVASNAYGVSYVVSAILFTPSGPNC